MLDHGYGAVRNTVRFVTERAGARMTEAAMPFPRCHGGRFGGRRRRRV